MPGTIMYPAFFVLKTKFTFQKIVKERNKISLFLVYLTKTIYICCSKILAALIGSGNSSIKLKTETSFASQWRATSFGITL